MKKGECIHYNGSFHNNSCKAGVVYKDVTPDWNKPGNLWRLPCHAPDPTNTLAFKHLDNRGQCDKYKCLSDKALKEHNEKRDAEFKERLEFTMPIIYRIKETHAGTSWGGLEDCPKCGGRLHIFHAGSNGHVHGKCETNNCLSWME